MQSGKAGSFLPTDEFLVKDPDQEKKFNFRLKESLSVACNQPLLQVSPLSCRITLSLVLWLMLLLIQFGLKTSFDMATVWFHVRVMRFMSLGL